MHTEHGVYVTTHFMRVREFMLKAKQECPTTPTMPSKEVRILRAKLIMEEALETIRKGLGVTVSVTIKDSPTRPDITEEELQFEVTGEGDLVELADGCADVKVVTTGTLIACGIPDRRLQETVDENNLAKFGPGHSIRADGKLVKPPGHKPPDIAAVLKGHGWQDPKDETQILPAVENKPPYQDTPGYQR